MTSFKTRKKDGQVFPTDRRTPRDSDSPQFVGIDKSQIEYEPKSAHDFLKSNPKSTLISAKEKVEGEGFKTDKVDETKEHYRFRQVSPEKFQESSFRTIDVGKPKGMKLIIGRPLGKKTTKVQSVLITK